MKKLTLFMLAACAWFTTATSAVADETTTTTTEPTVAEEPTAASSLTSGYYVVKAHANSKEGYLYYSSSNADRPFRVKPDSVTSDILAALSSNTTYVWYANVLSDGTFTLQNLGGGVYIPARNTNNENMNASGGLTFESAAVLKPQTYTSSSDSYTILNGGTLLASTNYTEIDRQIHCNETSELNLSYWDQGETTVNGKGTLTEFAFYKVTGDFSSVESSIEKGTILAVTETEGTTVRKWAGVSGQEYTMHADATSSTTTTTTNLGFLYPNGSIVSTTVTTKVLSPSNMVISSDNHDFTITSSSNTDVTYNNVVANADVLGKYYRIATVNSINNKYISSEGTTADVNGVLSDNGTPVRKTSSDSYLSQIWQLEEGENGTVHFKNTNTGAYIKGTWGSAKLDANSSNAGNYTIVSGTGTYDGFDSSNHFELQDVNGHNGQLNAFKGDWSDGLGVWPDYSDKGSYWTFEEVTTVPVTISEANYATVGYPFAVSVPSESGITAYTVSKAEGGYLTLSEITDGIIPANTGVILYHDGATTADLTITTSDKTIEGNLLTATTAKRTGYTSGDTYVLALNSAGNAAFLKSELTTVPANKAYVATTNIPAEAAANVLNFNFGGDVTGINAVNAASSKANTYYDLNGRRVLYPAHGIFVNGNGQKVLVK